MAECMCQNLPHHHCSCPVRTVACSHPAPSPAKHLPPHLSSVTTPIPVGSEPAGSQHTQSDPWGARQCWECWAANKTIPCTHPHTPPKFSFTFPFPEILAFPFKNWLIPCLYLWPMPDASEEGANTSVTHKALCQLYNRWGTRKAQQIPKQQGLPASAFSINTNVISREGII